MSETKGYLDMELLRFTTAGSVDDGKSTLIGRLLYDSKAIFEDQMEILKETSRLEEWEQAVALHDQISRMDMGTPNKTLANGIANISMKLSDLIENSVVYSTTKNKSANSSTIITI